MRVLFRSQPHVRAVPDHPGPWLRSVLFALGGRRCRLGPVGPVAGGEIEERRVGTEWSACVSSSDLSPTFEQYQTILDRGFGPFFARSVVAVVGSGALVLLLAVPCAYALAFRMIEGWRDTLFFFISTKFLPPVGIIVPIYIIMRDLQLLDNLLALVIMYTAMNLPIAIWMLRSFFEEVPPDVIQSAQVDGADVFTQMTKIILPMVAPGLTATMFIGMLL